MPNVRGSRDMSDFEGDLYVDDLSADEREQFELGFEFACIIDALANERCAACPLSCGDERTSPCTMHAQWLALLRHYAAIDLCSDDSPDNSPAPFANRLH